MFIPRSTEELEQAVLSGNLEETAIFDAKRDLPPSKKNLDIAIDITAMTVDGGVIIYGVNEDEDGRPTLLTPIDDFRNQKERIDQIVRTSIVEPPTIHIDPIPSSKDPSKGYLVVFIPQSERAPHMVIAKNDYCYYGRTSSGNAKLTEGQVAQLYQRRIQWEVDRDSFLAQEISKSPYENVEGLSYLHVFIKPVGTHNGFIKNAMPQNQLYQAFFSGEFAKISDIGVYQRQEKLFHSRPKFSIEPNGYKIYFGEPSQDTKYQLDVLIDDDGMGHLFWGQIASVWDSSKGLAWNYTYAIDIVVHFLTIMANLYEKGSYFGNLDIGLAITGAKGIRVCPPDIMFIHQRDLRTYPENVYKHTTRKSCRELKENPVGTTVSLVKRFADVLTNGDSKWIWPENS